MINLIETFMRPVVKTKKGYRMKKGDPNYLVLNFSVDGWTAYVPKDDKQESIYDVIKSLNLLEVDYSVEKYNSQFGYGSCLLVITEKNGEYQKGLCFRGSRAVEVVESIEKITIIEPKEKLEVDLKSNNNNNTRRNKI
jgi:hypothetical protein